MQSVHEDMDGDVLILIIISSPGELIESVRVHHASYSRLRSMRSKTSWLNEDDHNNSKINKQTQKKKKL